MAKEKLKPLQSTPIVDSDEALLLRAEIMSSWDSCRLAVETNQKDYLKRLHIEAKSQSTEIDPVSVLKSLLKYSTHFKHGCEIYPDKIEPQLILVEPGSMWEKIFKICRASWSMPYSKGYGRRLRFVVYDSYHKAVIGVIGLQSPAADLGCRDRLFSFPDGQKLNHINCMLDAYTIGAIPPYSNLLGGKLVASLVASDDVRQAYWRQYAGKKTLMQGKLLPQPLLAVTTASAYGRSSIYNRLKYRRRVLAEPIGWTKGYGMLHLEKTYPAIIKWLSTQNALVSGGFGNGPRVRWQNTCNAMTMLGIPRKYSEHGIQREVFIFRLVSNLEKVCNEGAMPIPISCSTKELSDYWKERWAIPRSMRDESWRDCDTQEYLRKAIIDLL